MKKKTKCKDCKKKGKKQKDKEVVLKYHKEYYRKNKERISEYKKRWYRDKVKRIEEFLKREGLWKEDDDGEIDFYR